MAGSVNTEPMQNSIGSVSRDDLSLEPILARTSTVHRTVGPVAYDCVKIIVVRDGSAFLFSEFGQQPVKPGDVILLGANVLCGSEPEGHITVTTIYADTDYMLDQIRWQYTAFLQDRLDAQGFADMLYTEPAQLLRLGEHRAGMLMPWLDEMVSLSLDGRPVRHYLRMQALWFQIAYVIAPYIKVSTLRLHRRNERISGLRTQGVGASRLCEPKSVTSPRCFGMWTRYVWGGGMSPCLNTGSR